METFLSQSSTTRRSVISYWLDLQQLKVYYQRWTENYGVCVCVSNQVNLLQESLKDNQGKQETPELHVDTHTHALLCLTVKIWADAEMKVCVEDIVGQQ